MMASTKALEETLTPGILTGQGTFETMRSYDGRIFALDEHLSRLLWGLKYLHIQAPFLRKGIKEKLYLSLESNSLKDARIRLTIWRQKNKTRMSIVIMPYRSISLQKYKKGFKADVADVTLPDSINPNIKSIHYIHFLKAYKKAKSKGYDETILLNKQGHITEGSRSNIFFFKDGCLFTPILSCGCLDGITRRIVMKLVSEMSIPCREVAVHLSQLLTAHEAFLTNSLIEIMPLTRIQHKTIGQGKPGKITRMILKKYQNFVQQNVSLVQ